MNVYEKTRIETMETVLLNLHKVIENECDFVRQDILKREKDAMIAALIIMGYMVTCNVDMDLNIISVHVRKI